MHAYLEQLDAQAKQDTRAPWIFRIKTGTKPANLEFATARIYPGKEGPLMLNPTKQVEYDVIRDKDCIGLTLYYRVNQSPACALAQYVTVRDEEQGTIRFRQVA